MPPRPDAARLSPEQLASARRATRLLVGVRERLDRTRDETRHLLTSLDPDDLSVYWAHERVLGLAVARAAAIGVQRPSWNDAADAVRSQAGELNDLQEVVAVQVTRALAKREIPAVVVKGAFMAGTLYGDRDLRGASGDLDILVSAPNLRPASDVVQQLGWSAPTDPRVEGDLPNYHLVHLSPSSAPDIEVHWRLQWYDREDHTRGILTRADLTQTVATPAPADILSVLLFCFARDGFHKLRLAADIAAWWDRFGQDEGVAVLERYATDPLARPLLIASEAAAATVGTPTAPRGSADDAAARVAVGIARADRPLDKRHFNSQIVLIDVLIAPPGQRLRRWRTGWLRDTGSPLRERVPYALIQFAVPVIRIVICARTAVHALGTAWAVVRAESRADD